MIDLAPPLGSCILNLWNSLNMQDVALYLLSLSDSFHLKKLLLIAPLALLLTSCSVLKRNTSASPDNSSTSSKPKQTNPVFIENISLKNGNTSQTVSNNKAEGRSISASQGKDFQGLN